jgi:hypothetical protein
MMAMIMLVVNNTFIHHLMLFYALLMTRMIMACRG